MAYGRWRRRDSGGFEQDWAGKWQERPKSREKLLTSERVCCIVSDVAPGGKWLIVGRCAGMTRCDGGSKVGVVIGVITYGHDAGCGLYSCVREWEVGAFPAQKCGKEVGKK